jgi:carbamate kinase
VRVVVALGGNALLRRGEAPSLETQRTRVQSAARAIAELAGDHTVVVTHGNGPQVGLLALLGEAYRGVDPYPLDVLGAESEGLIGYLIEQALVSRLPDREIATLLTQVEVAADDPAFAAPSKPIGPVYSDRQVEALGARPGRVFAREPAGLRRVVPSPEPLRILELRTIRRLVDAGVLLICAGGGGIPVVVEPDGEIRGAEAVVDKDLAAALLARDLGAEGLLMLTDVPAVYADWPAPRERPVRRVRASDLDPEAFEAGSMAPKVKAARRFAEATGGLAGIGALEDAGRILRGEAGTLVSGRG